MQYHASLITADGAYHCPVGSIMAIFLTNVSMGTRRGTRSEENNKIFSSVLNWSFLFGEKHFLHFYRMGFSRIFQRPPQIILGLEIGLSLNIFRFKSSIFFCVQLTWFQIWGGQKPNLWHEANSCDVPPIYAMKSVFGSFQGVLKQNITRIANAVQVTLWLCQE